MIQKDLESIRIIQTEIEQFKKLRPLFDAYLSRLLNGEQPGGELDAIAALKGMTRAQAEERFGTKSGPESSGRSATKRLRDELRSFNSTPLGRRLPIRLEVPPGVYGLACHPQSPNLKRFWKPYIELDNDSDRKVFLVYTEHQFFGHLTDDYIVRHRDANHPGSDINALMPFLPEKDRSKLTPTRQFVNSGDVQALLRFSSFFGSMMVPTEHLAAHTNKLRKFVKGNNIILLGNSRSCKFISRMQAKLEFAYRCQKDGVHIENPKRGEKDFYATPYKTREILHGTVSRAHIESLEAQGTAIVSNHGRFISAMAYTLTQEKNVARFLKKLRFDEASPVPAKFEALVGITPPEDDDSEMIGHEFEVIATRFEPS